MARHLYPILILLFPLFCQAAPANEQPAHLLLLEQARLKSLSEHPYWHALLHYKPNASPAKVLSEILSPEFFNHPHGYDNPAAELEATILAVLEKPNADHNQHAQCRFIARYQWLLTELDWSESHPPVAMCDQYLHWTNNNSIDSLSLVFATGYLDNPASFFGHLLLKFNTDRTVVKSQLLDQSINFGAIVPDGEHPFIYMTKGLFGGYESGFTHEQFYFHTHNYAENELRDLWEYTLSLSKAEVQQITYHAWELLGKKFRYYFMTENCAYRMGELINLVIEPSVLNESKPWSVPIDVFNKMSMLEHNGQPLIKSVRRIPSRQNTYTDKFLALDEHQQNILKWIVENDLNFSHADFTTLNHADRYAILDCLLDYYEFRIINAQQNKQLQQKKHTVLLALSTISIDDDRATFTPTILPPPHKGPISSSTRINLIHNNKQNSGINLLLRPAYYDFLGLDAGRLENSQLTMFDLSLTYLNDSLKLRYLDFVNIETLNMSKTRLAGDGGLAWKVKFGFENQDLSCSDCTIFSINGGLGKAFQLTTHSVLSGMLDIHLQSDYQNMGTAASTIHTSLYASPYSVWKTRIMVGYKNYHNHLKSHKRIFSWENRFFDARTWDLRITYREDVAREISAGISYYW